MKGIASREHEDQDPFDELYFRQSRSPTKLIGGSYLSSSSAK